MFFCDHWGPLGWLAGLPGPAGLAGMAIQKDRDHLRQDSFFIDFFCWSLGHRTLWGPKTKVSHMEVFDDLNNQICSSEAGASFFQFSKYTLRSKGRGQIQK